MVNPKLSRLVLFGVWSVDDTVKAATLPLVAKLIKGDDVTFYDVPKSEFKPYAVAVAKHSNWYGFKDAPVNSVAVIPVKGVITKEDQYCGPSGTVTLMRTLQAADKNENIIAHVLDMDSGGGEATNIASVASFIRNQISKPVFAWYNGLNASACYGIAVGADEIFAAQSTDIVGSIGVMTTIANWKEYYAKQGLNLEDVYSTLSSDKNGIWQEALKGNFKPLQEKVLDPFAKTFHDSVTSMRENLNPSVLKGATYMTEEATELGLIDGQKSWAEMLEYAETAGLSYQQNERNRIKNKNKIQANMNKKFAKIAAFFGASAIEQDSEGNVSLNEDQMNKIEAHLEASEGLEAKLTNAITAKFDAMKVELNNKINQFELQQTEMQKMVDAVSDLAPATAPVDGEEDAPSGYELSATEKAAEKLFGDE